MTDRLYQILFVAAAATFLNTGTALARFPGLSGHSKSAQIEVPYPAKIPNGPALEPGTYKVEVAKTVSSADVMFYHNGKLVGQAPAKLVDGSKKNDQTRVYYGTAGLV